jgi:spore maturation protein CgeB
MIAPTRLDVVVLGLSLSSSWGNGHATTYRSLLKAFAERGHRILFLEREVPWYQKNRDLAQALYCDLRLYPDVHALAAYREPVEAAHAVIVGSYVPEGVDVARWVQATARGAKVFYDIDTPVTLAKLARNDHEYLSPAVIPGFDLYLSFTGGPTLHHLMHHYGARRAEALYCSVDADRYQPGTAEPVYDLGYLGTYSADRQPALERLLLEPARRLPQRRFIVAGPLYPDTIAWPNNVERVDHIAPADHPAFYGSCRYTLNVTRADMIQAGYSPSVRLFEAAACATPIISDDWDGLDTLLSRGEEILIAAGTDDVVRLLTALPEAERRRIGSAARAKVLAAHTACHRAGELERHLLDVRREAPLEMVPASSRSVQCEQRALIERSYSDLQT